jgi:polar amino acid transport system substrate-binding protein
MVTDGWTRREFLRRAAAAGAVAIGGPVLLGGCEQVAEEGEDTLEAARQNNAIRIGIANESPFGFADQSGETTGESPEVARVVFRNMGIDSMHANVVTFDQLIPALNARQYDVVAAGMFITPERCREAAFSIPDYQTQAALLVPEGNPEDVHTFADIAEKGVGVAVLSGAVERGYAEAAGVASGDITTLDTQDSMMRNVADGRVYCAALTDISLQWLVQRNPDAGVEVTESFTAQDEEGEDIIDAGAFAFRPGDDSLREAFNEELRKLHESGEWLEIVEEFGFGEANLPGEDVTTEALCEA